MSEATTYEWAEIDGVYVLASDYDALKAEVEQTARKRDEYYANWQHLIQRARLVEVLMERAMDASDGHGPDFDAEFSSPSNSGAEHE